MASKCGDCRHVSYCYPLSEWWCKRYQTFLGHSIVPWKSHKCDVIGENGDAREMQAMFDYMEKIRSGKDDNNRN